MKLLSQSCKTDKISFSDVFTSDDFSLIALSKIESFISFSSSDGPGRRLDRSPGWNSKVSAFGSTTFSLDDSRLRAFSISLSSKSL